LKKLNASARNCRRKRSRKVKVLSNDRSTLLRPSPRVRGRLRPALPKEFRPAHQFRSPVLTEPHPDAHGSVESMCHGAATARGSGFHHGPLAAGGGGAALALLGGFLQFLVLLTEVLGALGLLFFGDAVVALGRLGFAAAPEQPGIGIGSERDQCEQQEPKYPVHVRTIDGWRGSL